MWFAVDLGNGLSARKPIPRIDGFEVNIALATLALAVAVLGGRGFSIDYFLG